MSIEAMKAARDYIRDVPPDAFFGALSRGTSALAKLNEAIAAAEKAEPVFDESDALTVAYLHGHGKGKDSVQPLLAEKDALLRQALGALEPFELSTSLAERTAEAIRQNLGVKND